MVVKVEEIPESGLELNEPISLELLGNTLSAEGNDTGFRPVRPSELSATLQKMSDGILVRGQFIVQLTSPCKRCLAEVVTEVPVPFALSLMPRSSAEKQRGRNAED